MFRRYLLSAAAVLPLLLLSLSSFSTDAPKVISTSPQNGAQNVDPSITEISVTFSEPMMDRSWSWSYEDKDKFPQMAGHPSYVNNMKCVLPVKLDPKKEYVVWINTWKHRNFRSKAGVPAEPFKFTFKTK